MHMPWSTRKLNSLGWRPSDESGQQVRNIGTVNCWHISDLLQLFVAGDISEGGYVLEDLFPRTTYDLRFGSKNRVGFSDWGSEQRLTMPAPGPPQPPTLKTEQFGIEMNGIIEVNTSNSYELSWKIPEDNGVPIDYFLLQYYPVTLNTWLSGIR